MAVLLPQDRFLLAAAAPDAYSSETLEDLLRDDSIDWGRALRHAVGNRVVAPAWALLRASSHRQQIEQRAAEAWQQANQLLILRHAGARKQALEVFAACADRGIQPLLYKGLDFSIRYYAQESPRAFVDLDIIVKQSEIARTDEVLRAAGYALPQDAPPLSYYQKFHLHACYSHPNWPHPVELHWALDSPYSNVQCDTESLFDAMVEVPELGPHIMRPSTLDTLVLMSIHLHKHLSLASQLPTSESRLKAVVDFGGLVWVRDLVLWMRRDGANVREEAVHRRIGELDAEESLQLSIRLAEDLDPLALPGWARALAARASRRPSALCRLVYPDLSSGRGVGAVGDRIRSLLLKPIPVLVLRPVRILEVFARSSSAKPGWRERISKLFKIGKLLATNLMWIARWQIQRLGGQR